MTLEESKSKLLETLKELKTILQHRKFDILEDLDIPEDPIRVNFNGWTTIEGFENQVFGLYSELQEALKVSYLYDLDNNKKDLLIKMLIDDLNFQNYIHHFKGEHNESYQLRKDQLEIGILTKLSEFEGTQDQLKFEILNNLSKMLSSSQDSTKIKYQFKWQGTQKQLAELFGKLILEGWIANPLEQEQSAFASTLSTIFDLTPTFKKDSPNVAENLRQHLKPELSKRGNLTFPNCVTGMGAFSDFPHNNKGLKNK